MQLIICLCFSPFKFCCIEYSSSGTRRQSFYFSFNKIFLCNDTPIKKLQALKIYLMLDYTFKFAKISVILTGFTQFTQLIKSKLFY